MAERWPHWLLSQKGMDQPHSVGTGMAIGEMVANNCLSGGPGWESCDLLSASESDRKDRDALKRNLPGECKRPALTTSSFFEPLNDHLYFPPRGIAWSGVISGCGRCGKGADCVRRLCGIVGFIVEAEKTVRAAVRCPTHADETA